MFGKPEWFVPKKFGWGLWPVAREGWIYTAVWAGVLLVPFATLLLVRGRIEAVVWLGAMILLLVVDVKFILRAIRRQEEEKDVLRIMDEEETRTEAAQTGKFAMQVTDSNAGPKASAT